MEKIGTIDSYNLYSGNYALTPDQITTSKFSVYVDAHSDSFKSTALTGSCLSLSGSSPVVDPITSSTPSPTMSGSSVTTIIRPSATSSATVSASATSTLPFEGWLTLGCYNDSVGARVLQNEGIVQGGPSNMTVENCETACLAEGYSLAGVEYSAECYCDNKLYNGGATATDGYAQCTMTCNGNSTEKCGGPNRLNIYQYISPSTSTVAFSTPTTTTAVSRITTSGGVGSSILSTSITSATPIATELPTGWTYQGCFVDNINGLRSMLIQESDNPTMTIESCVAECISLGYTVAGMEYSDQCFCDNYVRNNASLASSDSQCGMTCAGKTSEICGGPNLLSVYSNATITILPPPTVQTTDLPGSWVYKGCLQYVCKSTHFYCPDDVSKNADSQKG